MSAKLSRFVDAAAVGGATVALAWALAGAAPAHAELLAHKDLSYDVSKVIAETALETCRAKGYAVSVFVVGRDGETLVAMRGDGAGPHTWENARRKAYTARTTRAPSAAFAKRIAENNPLTLQQATLPGMIGIAGGLPIKVGDDTIGGVGISGSPSGNDEPCAQAGIDKVQDQLK